MFVLQQLESENTRKVKVYSDLSIQEETYVLHQQKESFFPILSRQVRMKYLDDSELLHENSPAVLFFYFLFSYQYTKVTF